MTERKTRDTEKSQNEPVSETIKLHTCKCSQTPEFLCFERMAWDQRVGYLLPFSFL